MGFTAFRTSTCELALTIPIYRSKTLRVITLPVPSLIEDSTIFILQTDQIFSGLLVLVQASFVATPNMKCSMQNRSKEGCSKLKSPEILIYY